MLHVYGFGRVRGVHRCLNHIHSIKYAEVINASSAANSA